MYCAATYKNLRAEAGAQKLPGEFMIIQTTLTYHGLLETSCFVLSRDSSQLFPSIKKK